MGRLTKTEQEVNNDPTNHTTTAQLAYNELGQLVNKNVGTIESTDYLYNIRGWLSKVNDPDNLGSKLFAMNLLYNDQNSGLGNAQQYNGNISGLIWNSTGKGEQGYVYSYDPLNRLTNSDYKTNSSGWIQSTAYAERGLTYDQNGNITHLERSDINSTNTVYAYNYDGTNKLQNITGFPVYSYDANGNTTTDGLRSMAISYNMLNLPQTISKGGESISYIYTATGEKVAKRMKDNSYQYYAGSFIYNNDKTLNYLLFSEGRVVKSSGIFSYEYQLKDHLGNTRVAFSISHSVLQLSDYYAFGSSFAPHSPNNDNKYLYNGKEIQDDILGSTNLDWLDYGARFYDPQIGRWHSVDPLAEKSRRWSPFTYCEDNPIRFIDPDGMELDNPGDYYKMDGTHFGSDGVADDKVYTADAVTKNGGGKVVSAVNGNEVKGLLNSELNTRAFLSSITDFEGGGYNIKYGGGTFEGNDHPGGVKNKNGDYNSPAGAYQITEGTAKGLMINDKTIKDFSPVNQDKMAVDIMKNSQNSLKDVKNGDLNSAVKKLTGQTGKAVQWEALPGGGPKSKSMTVFNNTFKNNISNELNNKSKLATPRGQLKIN